MKINRQIGNYERSRAFNQQNPEAAPPGLWPEIRLHSEVHSSLLVGVGGARAGESKRGVNLGMGMM